MQLPDLVSENDITNDYIIPKPFDPRIAPNVAKRSSKMCYGDKCG
jgi:hypothetical protein